MDIDRQNIVIGEPTSVGINMEEGDVCVEHKA
jgi:hypothetical protein